MTNEQIAAVLSQGEAPAPQGEPARAAPKGGATAQEPSPPETEPAPKSKLSWEEAVKTVPPDVATLMRNLHGEYTKKSQELSQLKKESRREREAMLNGSKEILTGQPKPLPAYDPFDESTVQARVEAEVQRRLQEVLAPMQQEYEVLAAEESYRDFVSANPDFEADTALRNAVQVALEANPSLDLETAYWAVKGKMATQERVKAEAKAKAEKEAAKKAALTGTGLPRKAGDPRAPGVDQLKKMSNADLLAHAKALNGIR